MLSKHTTKLLLILMVVISFALRLFQLGSLPQILNRDEAALAYNAYALLETGRDEWDREWPLTFESFGDYKLPGYIFSLIPLLKVLGLNDWVVRLPAALAGSALVLIGYFFGRGLNFSRKWSLLLAFFIGSTPVLFFFSRMAFEAMLALALFWGSITIFINSDRFRADFVGLILLLLAVFTYNTPLILLPFVLLFILGWRIAHQQNWLRVMVGIILIGGLAGYQLLSLSAQKSGITIFQDESIWQETINYRAQFDGVWQTILGNKYVYYFQVMAKNLVASFMPNFLLTGAGGHPWHSVPRLGHLTLPIYFLSIWGIFSLVIQSIKVMFKKQWRLLKLDQKQLLVKNIGLLFLLLCSLIPALITVDAPHATRSLFFMVLMVVMAVIGLQELYYYFLKHSYVKKYALIGLVGSIYLAASLNYFWQYFTQYPLQQKPFKPGFDQIIQATAQDYPNQEVAIVDPEGYQYILLAWYLRVPPAEFHDSNIRQLPDRIGFSYGERVGRYHFIAEAEDRQEKESVLIYWNGQQWQRGEY